MDDFHILLSGAPFSVSDEQAASTRKIAEGLVSAYCRGRHVDARGVYRPGVQSVIDLVAARLLANPGQVQYREQSGPFSTHRGEGFSGFTLSEQLVLNRYRKRAM